MKTEKAIFAAGCFWGVEEAFRTIDGVISTRVGYTGGSFDNPTYEDVCTDKTGHAEAIEITFNPDKVTFNELLDKFWSIHNPTTVNKQGPDVGSQYRSAIFYHNIKQKEIAEQSKKNLSESDRYKDPIVTEIAPLKKFWQAEEYHQKYSKKHNGQTNCPI